MNTTETKLYCDFNNGCIIVKGNDIEVHDNRTTNIKNYDIYSIEIRPALRFSKGHFIMNLNNGTTIDFKFDLEKQKVVESFKNDFDIALNKYKNSTSNIIDFGTFVFGIDYLGGIPNIKETITYKTQVTNNALNITIGKQEVAIPVKSIKSVQIETKEQIEKRITATRLLTLGIFSVAFKKKEKKVSHYLTIDYIAPNGLETTIIFIGKKINDLYSSLHRALSYITQNNYNKNETTDEITNEQIEKLKKLKELLDLDILSKEEFDSKKKEILNI